MPELPEVETMRRILEPQLKAARILRMTGQILATPKDFPEEKHTHVVMELSNGSVLRYIDTRRIFSRQGKRV